MGKVDDEDERVVGVGKIGVGMHRLCLRRDLGGFRCGRVGGAECPLGARAKNGGCNLCSNRVYQDLNQLLLASHVGTGSAVLPMKTLG